MSGSSAVAEEELRIVSAVESSAEDVQMIFSGGDATRCQCQWFRCTAAEHRSTPPAERIERFERQAHFGNREASNTAGLVAYLEDEPVGWCAVAPRSAYVRLRSSRLVWADRDEDPDDESVWAVTCFVTRKGYRRRGISYSLARAAIDFARAGGAKALEGYPLITEPGKEVGWGELFVGSSTVFAKAGFLEVTRPTKRRAVMRTDL